MHIQKPQLMKKETMNFKEIKEKYKGVERKQGETFNYNIK
jgi:plasmid rolling circle replication initiator protein Rep